MSDFRPRLAFGLMYGCIVKEPSSLLYASCISTDSPATVQSRRTFEWNAYKKLSRAIINSKRALQRGDLRRSRYWTNCGTRWAEKLKIYER